MLARNFIRNSIMNVSDVLQDNVQDKVAGGTVVIYENTTLRDKTNNWFYTLKIGNDKSTYSLTPGCQFFVAVVQGKYETQGYTGDGSANQSIQVTVNNNSTIDNFDCIFSLASSHCLKLISLPKKLQSFSIAPNTVVPIPQKLS